MGCIWAMCAQLRLHYRMVSLLLLGVFVSVACGIVGTYFTIFGDISVNANRTVAFDRSVGVLRKAYDEGRPPKPFRDWSIAGAACYLFFLFTYYVCACSTIWRRCAERARALADERGWSDRHHARHYQHAPRPDDATLDDASSSLEAVHAKLCDFNRRQAPANDDAPHHGRTHQSLV